jgi:hypothetical protein
VLEVLLILLRRGYIIPSLAIRILQWICGTGGTGAFDQFVAINSTDDFIV